MPGKSEQPQRLELPPVLAETGQQILRLARLVGTDPTVPAYLAGGIDRWQGSGEAPAGRQSRR